MNYSQFIKILEPAINICKKQAEEYHDKFKEYLMEFNHTDESENQ